MQVAEWDSDGPDDFDKLDDLMSDDEPHTAIEQIEVNRARNLCLELANGLVN